MNLRRVRIRLTAMFALITALAVVTMAVIAARSGTQRIEEQAERDLETELASLLLENDYWDDEFSSPNTWIVNPDQNYATPLGDTWVEPPLFTIANNASPDWVLFERFEQNGSWLAVARMINDFDSMIIVQDFGEAEASASSLRWRLGLAAAAITLAAAAAAWWLAGRSLAPARQAMSQQRDFMADAAHELRTPLAIIQASASQALSRQREAWEYQRSLSEIQVAAERAGSGVGSLLELARLEAGQVVPRLAPLRLDLLLEEVAAATRLDGVEIVAEVGEPVIVNADYSLLRQGLSNLAMNAGARSERVILRIRRDEPWAITEVADDGPGFDPEVLPHVFTRFRRGDEKGSTGLGLAIVKTIVDAHRGEISASNRPGGGAAITVKLKLG